MKLENPRIREGINISEENPLKEFFQMLAGFIAVALLVIAFLHFTIGYFARLIPFGYEQQMVEGFDYLQVEPSAQQTYLQSMADELAAHMDLPEDMKLVVHYDTDKTVNALATLGGHIFIYQGLIDSMPNENALAMVIAHEIAHIKHRHPIVAAGKGLTLMVLAAAISGSAGSEAGEMLLGQSINISLLNFSRSQERQADMEALQAINRYYGHVSGAKDLFSVFSNMKGGIEKNIPEFLLSHPLSEKRWQLLQDYALQNGLHLAGEPRPLNIPKKQNK